MRVNPFKEVYQEANSCNSGNIPDFPVIVDIELTNHCNFNCKMCAGKQLAKRPKGNMIPRVWDKLIKELAANNTPVRFIRWGEPTIHPKFIEYVRSARSNGLLVHVNTNGSNMIGLEYASSVKFSFQGVDQTSYYLMRGSTKFNELVRRVKVFTNRPVRPYVSVGTTITDEDPKNFVDMMSFYVDDVSVGKTVEYNKPQDLKPMVNCTEVFSKLSINWDGSVSACCADYDNMMIVGDIECNTLKEIWEGPKLKLIRAMVASKKHLNHPLCKNCYEYTEKEV